MNAIDSPSLRRASMATVGALLAVLAWEFSGLDMALAAAFANGQAGFPLHDAFLTRTVLHQGGRWAMGLVLLLLLAQAVRARKLPAAQSLGAPNARERWFWLAVTLLALVAVPALKRYSASSCPWDLVAFGGSAPYVPHWRLGQVDGGPGHCFPAGHAAGAFAFAAQYFLWRPYSRYRALLWLAGALGAGFMLGLAQQARGAHFMSHTLWAAWLTWAVALLAACALAVWRQGAPQAHPR